METLGNYIKENMFKVIIITLLLFLYVGSFIYISTKIIKTESKPEDKVDILAKEDKEEEKEETNTNEIVVDIKGSVKKP